MPGEKTGRRGRRLCDDTRGAVPGEKAAAPLTSGSVAGRRYCADARSGHGLLSRKMQSVPPGVLCGARLPLAGWLVGKGQNGGGRSRDDQAAPALTDGGRSPQPGAGQWLPVRGRCAGGEYSLAQHRGGLMEILGLGP